MERGVVCMVWSVVVTCAAVWCSVVCSDVVVWFAVWCSVVCSDVVVWFAADRNGVLLCVE